MYGGAKKKGKPKVKSDRVYIEDVQVYKTERQEVAVKGRRDWCMTVTKKLSLDSVAIMLISLSLFTWDSFHGLVLFQIFVECEPTLLQSEACINHLQGVRGRKLGLKEFRQFSLQHVLSIRPAKAKSTFEVLRLDAAVGDLAEDFIQQLVHAVTLGVIHGIECGAIEGRLGSKDRIRVTSFD
jgi:hypothetical protein